MNNTNTTFAIAYTFMDDSRETEISMLVNGKNILEYSRNGRIFTTRWDLEELVMWLRNFVDNMKEDPYPIDVDGEYAAIKDENSRTFDSDDLDEFDAYYDKLDEWNLRHRWHTASAGAILSDVYFQMIGDCVEISWNNKISDKDVRFVNVIGGCRINKDLFVAEVNSFLYAYAMHWYK
ncbi:MAG: hypothetical protein J6U54_17840 [Clostridiales bacterium]|nr:hypothetical protein [Clostridiales bacterium]